MNNPLVTPELGLIIWSTIVFCILFFLLAKYAWKPILKAVKEREASIENALNAAEQAKKEMQELSANNEVLLNQARAERDEMLKDARAVKDKMISEAKVTANAEAERIIASAKEAIQHEKLAAITELKNQVATLSIEIAEKIIKQELSTAEKQKSLIDNAVSEINLN
ncbi:MAG TPA: F0F1 ATP synthase subunit B [Vicingus sp.]|nr:F0F1 ATP synthase subunit B [Vicingus sp.]HRP60305.1 F0F1 ATP synthase subunit B [Vicingus sp.]